MRKLILWLLPERFVGIALFGRVYMREFNEITLAHERVHARQQKENPFLFYLRYLFSHEWRFKYEAEAYAASVRAGLDIKTAAAALFFDYRLSPRKFTYYKGLNKIKQYISRQRF